MQHTPTPTPRLESPPAGVAAATLLATPRLCGPETMSPLGGTSPHPSRFPSPTPQCGFLGALSSMCVPRLAPEDLSALVPFSQPSPPHTPTCAWSPPQGAPLTCQLPRGPILSTAVPSSSLRTGTGSAAFVPTHGPGLCAGRGDREQTGEAQGPGPGQGGGPVNAPPAPLRGACCPSLLPLSSPRPGRTAPAPGGHAGLACPEQLFPRPRGVV